MTYQTPEMCGNLFKNSGKQTEKHPDYCGDAVVLAEILETASRGIWRCAGRRM